MWRFPVLREALREKKKNQNLTYCTVKLCAPAQLAPISGVKSHRVCWAANKLGKKLYTGRSVCYIHVPRAMPHAERVPTRTCRIISSLSFCGYLFIYLFIYLLFIYLFINVICRSGLPRILLWSHLSESLKSVKPRAAGIFTSFSNWNLKILVGEFYHFRSRCQEYIRNLSQESVRYFDVSAYKIFIEKMLFGEVLFIEVSIREFFFPFY